MQINILRLIAVKNHLNNDFQLIGEIEFNGSQFA